MRFFTGAKFWLTLAILASLSLTSGVALAHEDREFGELQLVVGFINEPAFEGFKNGVSIRVMKHGGGHDHEMEQPGATGHGHGDSPSIDVKEHGALFVSDALAHDQSFSYEVPHDLMGQTVPYHSHLDHDITGSVTVSMDAELSGTVEIEIHDGAYHPADITVQPGATLVWTNRGEDPQNITSGLFSEAGPSHEEASPVPVTGLESALQVEVTHAPTGVSKVMSLRPVFKDPGHYTADLIPTAPGQYTFRFFGNVEGVELDETFESGPGRFDDVRSSESLQFPEALPAVREVEGAVRGAQSTARQAQDAAIKADSSASSASTLGIIGIVLGAVGVVSGAGGVMMGLRRR